MMHAQTYIKIISSLLEVSRFEKKNLSEYKLKIATALVDVSLKYV